MAGGTWTVQNKKQPGAYVNVIARQKASVSDGVIGVTALPIALNFGPNEVVAVNATSDLTVFGYGLEAPEMLPLRETLKGAQTVLLYRVGGGGKATAIEGELVITALYGGTRGNKISIISKANINNPTSFDVETYLAGNLIDTQTVTQLDELQSNQVVSFVGVGELTAFTTTLGGGTDTAAVVQDYMNFFNAVQFHEFNTLAMPVSEEAIKIATAAFIKRLREDEGVKVQAYVADYNADHEGIVNVTKGVILANGATIPSELAVCWSAGAAASAGVTSSLTYTPYPGAVDVTQKLSSIELDEALSKGEFVFIQRKGQAVVLQDINSLVTYTATKSRDLSKNRILRALDDIANVAKTTFEDHFIGQINNDTEGQDLLKSNYVSYLGSLRDQGAIAPFDIENDVVVEQGDSKDGVVVQLAVEPYDSMEKLYMTVYVQ